MRTVTLSSPDTDPWIELSLADDEESVDLSDIPDPYSDVETVGASAMWTRDLSGRVTSTYRDQQGQSYDRPTVYPQQRVGTTPKRVDPHVTDNRLTPAEALFARPEHNPARPTVESMNILRRQSPLTWSNAGSSIAWRDMRPDSDFVDEVADTAEGHGFIVTRPDVEYTRYSTHANGLDRVIPDAEWETGGAIPRTDALLSDTREMAKRVRQQYRHLGGKSKLDSTTNQRDGLTTAMVRGHRRRNNLGW